MGKFDKDRNLKELAIRYCIARGLFPFLEVFVQSSSDLSDAPELLTDIDVLGLEFQVDGGVRRTIFDCKSGKMSPISRAFWAGGLLQYTSCDEAYVLIKNKAVNNHRLSALSINVDLHDEQSFISLAETFDIGFNRDLSYQSSIDRWNAIFDIYSANRWSEAVYGAARQLSPLSRAPWVTFRKLVAELRGVRGNIDPARDAHLAMYLDVLSSALILWSAMGRDVRRFYHPDMTKAEFEKALRYYIWGGKEAYSIRQELTFRAEDGTQKPLEMYAWDGLVKFAGIVIAAPQELFGCASISRNMSIRTGCGANALHDANLSAQIGANKRSRQFIMALSDYMISACGLPRDLTTRVQASFVLS